MDRPNVGRKPGQHEEQDRLLRQMLKEQEKARKAMEKLVAEVAKLHTVHEVRIGIPHLDEILVIVKDIQARIGTGSGGVTKEEIDRVMGPVVEDLSTVVPPTPAIEPNPTG